MILGTYIYNTDYYKYERILDILQAFRTLVSVVNELQCIVDNHVYKTLSEEVNSLQVIIDKNIYRTEVDVIVQC